MGFPMTVFSPYLNWVCVAGHKLDWVSVMVEDPLLTHWRYCILALNNRYAVPWFKQMWIISANSNAHRVTRGLPQLHNVTWSKTQSHGLTLASYFFRLYWWFYIQAFFCLRPNDIGCFQKWCLHCYKVRQDIPFNSLSIDLWTLEQKIEDLKDTTALSCWPTMKLTGTHYPTPSENF